MISLKHFFIRVGKVSIDTFVSIGALVHKACLAVAVVDSGTQW